ncbi:MAG: hypothetical protein JWP91_1594 [Fibrobacteres bacterium]|nr:hypothetical protein [Fibrobacterota bacterium]
MPSGPLFPSASWAPRLALLAALLLPLGSAEAQIQYRSDFEDEDPACFSDRPAAGCKGWMGIHDDAISLCQWEYGHSGRQCLRLNFTKNEDYGGTWRKADTRHIFTRFYDYYDEGFDFAAGMKIHRLSGFNEAKQVNDFDIILQLKADAPNADYCGLTDAKYLALSFNGGPVDWGSVEVRWTPERKRWYAIETEIKLNTPGSSDGEVRIWIDGRKMAEKTGMNLTAGVSSPINRVLFGGWYSNAAAGKNPCPNPVGPSRRYVDDPAVSGSYIGPIPTITLGPSPGTRTLSLVLPAPGTLKVEFGKDAGYGLATPSAASPNGVHTAVLTGLDTNRAYHYRVKSVFNTGYEYVSPDYTFSTSAAASLPPIPVPPARKPRTPRNLRAHEYDPIPD